MNKCPPARGEEPLSRTRQEINNLSSVRPVGCSPARCRINPGGLSRPRRAGLGHSAAPLFRTCRRTALPRAAGQHSPGSGEQDPAASSARQRCGVAASRSARSPDHMTRIPDPGRDSAAVRWSTVPLSLHAPCIKFQNFSESESFSISNRGPNRKLKMKPKHFPNSKSVTIRRRSDHRIQVETQLPLTPGPRP